MFGWTMSTSSISSACIESLYSFPITPEITGGAIRSAARPMTAADLAFMFHVLQLPSDRLASSPKMLRLVSHIQREPPRLPVNSYH